MRIIEGLHPLAQITQRLNYRKAYEYFINVLIAKAQTPEDYQPDTRRKLEIIKAIETHTKLVNPNSTDVVREFRSYHENLMYSLISEIDKMSGDLIY